MAKPLIFATGSVPRRNLLKVYEFENHVEFVASDFNEDLGDKSTTDYCLQTAMGKASAVYDKNPDAIVVGFDTMISMDEKLIGKPLGRDDARSILKLLSGKSHRVITGMVIMSEGKLVESTTITQVTFTDLSNDVVEYYLNTLEWMGKAGGYGIQGIGAMLVEKIDGCYCNVVGVPYSALMKSLMKEFNVKLKSGKV